MKDPVSLLWVRKDGSVYRVWITHSAVADPAGGYAYHAIHFADPEWREVGSAPVDPSVGLEMLAEEDIQALLERALRAR